MLLAHPTDWPVKPADWTFKAGLKTWADSTLHKTPSILSSHSEIELRLSSNGSFKDGDNVISNPQNPPHNVLRLLPYATGAATAGTAEVGQERRRVRAPGRQDITTTRWRQQRPWIGRLTRHSKRVSSYCSSWSCTVEVWIWRRRWSSICFGQFSPPSSRSVFWALFDLFDHLWTYFASKFCALELIIIVLNFLLY